MSGKRAKILVADDEKTYIDVLVGLLENDYQIIVAKNGEGALTKALTDPPPDLILLDILMPGDDGYQVCRKLKQHSKTKHIPVIFLSALDEVENKMKGFEAGGVDYITKPFQGREVLARVATHMRLQELHQQLEKDNVRFKSLAEAAFEGILIHNQGWILEANKEAIRLLDWEEERFWGQNLMNFMPGECRNVVLNENEGPWEGWIETRRGKLIPVEIRTKKMEMKKSLVYVTAIRDLSAQKAIEDENKSLHDENRVLKKSMKERFKFGNMVGKSPLMQFVYERVASAAASDFHVIIYGESGTGKELAARTIHEMSQRREEAFVGVNCGAITESLFEREFFGHSKGAFTHAEQSQMGFFDAANRGALFLDEISELKPAMQVKLLRVLENGEYFPVGGTTARRADVRIISATNKDLSSLVRLGEFREDLFYRIHVIEIVLPPLKDRKEDIPLLIDFFLSRFSVSGKPLRLPGRALDALYHYDWPGNVRELKNIIQRFIATGQLTLPGESVMHVAEKAAGGAEKDLTRALEELECKLIHDALQEAGWHRGKTAEILNIPRRTLQRKMIKYGLRGDDPRD